MENARRVQHRARGRVMLFIGAVFGVFILALMFLRYAMPEYELGTQYERNINACAKVGVYIALALVMLLVMRYRYVRAKFDISQKRAIAVLVACTIVSRLLLISLVTVTISSDFKMYFDMAKQYAETGFYNDSDYIVVVAPNIVLYIIIMGEVFKTFGCSVFVAQCMNLCFLTGSVVTLYLLAREVLKPGLAFWAAMLFVLSPSNVLFSLQVNTEPMGLLPYIWGTLCIVRALRGEGIKRQIKLSFIGGLLLCFSNSIRSSALIMLLTLVVWGFSYWQSDKAGFARRTLMCFCVAAAGFFALNAGIGVIRNEVFEGKKTGIGYGWTLFEGLDLESAGGWTAENAQTLYDTIENYPTDEVQTVLLNKTLERVSEYTPAQWGRMIIKKNINIWIYNDYAYSPLMVYNEDSPINPLDYKTAITTVVNGAYLLWLAAMAIALVYHAITQWNRRQDGTLTLLLLPLIIMLIWHSFGTSIPRYHYYAIPTIIMITLYCVQEAARGAENG